MRLFFGLRPSLLARQQIVERLSKLSSAAPQVSWVPEDNLHLTLAFLGEVEPEMLASLQLAATNAVRGNSPVALGFGQQAGAFAGWHHPRVIWLGVDAASELRSLYQTLWAELAPLGFLDQQRFQPHITLGRVKQPLSIEIVDSMRALSWSLPPEVVNHLTLFESVLKPGGPIYRELAIFPLGR